MTPQDTLSQINHHLTAIGGKQEDAIKVLNLYAAAKYGEMQAQVDELLSVTGCKNVGEVVAWARKVNTPVKSHY